MKVNKEIVRGKKRWVADGRINGKRKRLYFDTQAQARTYIKQEASDTSVQQWWLDLSHGSRSKIIALAEEDGHSTKYIAQRDWSIIAKKLKNNSDKTFQNYNPNDLSA